MAKKFLTPVNVTVSTGTAPFTVASTTVVTNLNADLLDGQQGSYYAPNGSPTFTGTVTAPTLSLTTADTATAASHYYVETATDGVVRPKTLANVQTEVVSNTAMQSNVVSPTSEGSTGIRKTTVSTSAPTGGADGDVWLVYT